MRQYDFVLFDMDGTLVDSAQGHKKMFLRFWEKHYPELARDGQNRRVIGNTLREVFLRAGANEDGIAEMFHKLELFYKEQADDIIEQMTLVEGARETLECLRENGVTTVLATNSMQALVEKVVAALGLEGSFDLVMGADISFDEKPARFAKLCDRLKIPHGRALYLGDSEHDPVAASEAGLDCCILYSPISWVKSEGELMRSYMPDYIIKDIRRVAAIVL
ncbi:HAD hydrolase-like protein [Christensenellaceae bacterium OttesenSCG-928-K19]|nr:HAD hydrolase-like protein [Christensenellaceae bacterium OttesenSCG-928-K19]